MLGGILICAVAIGTAALAPEGEGVKTAPTTTMSPAATAERAVHVPDTLPLLMQDDRTTWGTPASIAQIAPGFNMTRPVTLAAAPQMPDNLTRFEEMGAPQNSFAYLLAASDIETTAFAPATYITTPGIRLTARYRAEPMGGATDALTVGSTIPRASRPRRSPFDTMLVFRLDGETSSPPIRFGGGVASVLNVIPRQ